MFTEDDDVAIKEETDMMIEDSIKFAEQSPSPVPEDTFTDVFYEGGE